MISRLSLAFSKEKIEDAVGKRSFLDDYAPSFHISPLDNLYVIPQERPDGICRLTWGLVPESSKTGINEGNLYNAFHEGIASKISYRMPIRKRRCIILADSFYVLDKECYRVLRQDKSLLLIAGLYDVWQSSDGSQKTTCTVLTTTSNRDVYDINKQSPAIIPQDKMEQWLSDNTRINEVLDMLRPMDNYSMSYYRITDRVRDKSFDSNDLHTELIEERTLFNS